MGVCRYKGPLYRQMLFTWYYSLDQQSIVIFNLGWQTYIASVSRVLTFLLTLLLDILLVVDFFFRFDNTIVYEFLLIFF